MKEKWDQRYADKEYIYGTTPNILLKEFIDQHKPGRILFPAEGEGRNAVYAAVKGWQVDAMDFSNEARQKALKLAEKNNISMQYSVCNIMDFPFEKEYYDAIALIYVHLIPSMRKVIHQKVIDALKPGGHLILMAFDKQQIHKTTGGPKSTALLYDKDMLENDFKVLKFLKFETTDIELNEGMLHKGISTNIQLIAQKDESYMEFDRIT
jgi:SAM-dependent methyltransferase